MTTPDPDGRSDAAVLLDARGERCPLPVIRLGRLARDLGPGALVRLLATDPAAASDVPAFCRMRGHELLSTTAWADSHVSTPTPSPVAPESPMATAYLVRVSATTGEAGR